MHFVLVILAAAVAVAAAAANNNDDADVVVDRMGYSLAGVAQVHEYIGDSECLEMYIRKSAPACVRARDSRCFAHGTDAENGCVSIDRWQWQDFSVDPAHEGAYAYHAPGVNPYPLHRRTHAGSDTQKVVWAYTGSIRQGEAYQVYLPDGQVTTETLLQTPVNHVTFIANVDVEDPTHWFSPGKNNTNGCGQLQTWELPFGFSGHNATTSLPKFKENLRKLHSNGLTVTLTMGSWCTQFPINPQEEWDESKFEAFVTYFKTVREDTFGGALDGIDFDWEGFCSEECLKGARNCARDDAFCGSFSPEELATGKRWTVPPVNKNDKPSTFECWMMPTKSTMQVMTGITHWMKKAGFVVTLVPMSTSFYTSEPDKTPKQVLRNEYGKYHLQPYPGGKPIDGSGQVDLLKMVDGVLLQWYSGFDAALCHNSPNKACQCDNIQPEGYPNTINISDGLIMSYYDVDGVGGNMFPSTFPVRCQACGPNVLLPNGTRGNLPCAPKTEAWFEPGNNTGVTERHKAAYANYIKTHNGSVPYWWVQNMTVNSKCPRRVDCPDWRYEGEQPYQSQMTLLESIGKLVDLDIVSIGFEALGTDVQAQYQAYVDPALPWTDITAQQKAAGIYYSKCSQNMTKGNIAQEKRCGQPLLSQQWGLKFVADDVIGLTNAVKAKTGKTLAGVGFFTLDGLLNVHGTRDAMPRIWCEELQKLNKDYKLPCHGANCGVCV